ncbi:MAG: hypothetical protein C5B58_01085 [Acidobacteria bacterium]|nr:MAG: hypothetical protein C5B58_01085 [Acidobacteriota bacterium]
MSSTSLSLFSMTGFLKQEHDSERSLKLALQESRKWHTITTQDQQLLHSQRQLLCSVNTAARILWAKAVCQEFQDFFRLDDDRPFPDRQLFFATLTDISCCTAHDAPFIDVQAFKKTLRRGLKGLSYIGMIEPALYVNIAAGTRWSCKRAVSWHVHAICWGEDRKKMRKRFAWLNRQEVFRSIMPGQRGAHQKEIPAQVLADGSRTFLADKLRYMLKSPSKAYRIYRAKNGDEDEIKFRQIKSDLRPGDRIDLFHLTKGLYLDELAVGGGEGTDMLRRIKRAVLGEPDR